MATPLVHIPVLQKEVLSFFPTHAKLYVDGTIGSAGHAEAICNAFPDVTCIGFDRDEDAVAYATKKLSRYGTRITLHTDSYENIPDVLQREGLQADCILLDLGFSTPQIEDEGRGFSFQKSGVLDMRFDRKQELTASHVCNYWSEQELERVLREFGEEPQSKNISHAIIQKRKQKQLERTEELVELILEVYRKKLKSKKEIPWIGGLHPATRSFQALRIAVNDELGTLTRALSAILPVLNPNGRLMVITFHSLEDRIVKHFFKNEARNCICPPEFPQCVCDHHAQIRIITKKGITSTAEEQKINSRSRSARLRVAEKI